MTITFVKKTATPKTAPHDVIFLSRFSAAERRKVHRSAAAGELTRVYKGVYVSNEGGQAEVERRVRAQWVDIAGMLIPGGVVSHISAFRGQSQDHIWTVSHPSLVRKKLELPGLAFQLVDDLLDFTASPEQLGKPVLSDLKEGKVTLPLIYAMENGHRDARELVIQVLKEKEFNSVRPETLVALVQDSGALGRARELAHDYARRAKACLNGHANSEYGRALMTLPDFILSREN